MKNHVPICAALALASACWPAPAWSQTVYRCGNVYGQVPCPGGTPIDASDPRTPAQKAQTDAATRQASASALKMEKDRVALEKRSLGAAPNKHTPATSGGRPTQGNGKDLPSPTTNKKSGKTAPDYFTAAAAPDDKKAGKADSKAAPRSNTPTPGSAAKP